MFRTAKLDVWQLCKPLRVGVWFFFLLLFHEERLNSCHSTWIMSWSNPSNSWKAFFIFVRIFPLATVKALVVFSSVLFYLCRSEREKENFRITVSCQYFGCSSCILDVDVDMGDLFHSAFLPAHFHPSLGRTRVWSVCSCWFVCFSFHIASNSEWGIMQHITFR